MSGFPSNDASTVDDSLSSPRDMPTTHAPPPSLPTILPPAPLAISAAIAKFRPTPKEVINGIAPHVFDERRTRRRRRSRSPSPHPAPHYSQRKGQKLSSPLRISGVFEVDSDGESIIFLEQTDHHHHHIHHHNPTHSYHNHHSDTVTKDSSRPTSMIQERPATPEVSQPIIRKIDKRRSYGFRIDSIRIFKTIAVKLK